MNERTYGTVLVLLASVGFATITIFGKLAHAARITIPTLLSTRFAIATVVLWTVVRLSRGSLGLPPRDRGLAFALGALVYASMSEVFFLGLEYLTAGLAAIVFYTAPGFTAVLSAAVLDEPLTERKLLALGLTFGGIALLTGADPGGANLLGILLMLAGAVIYAVYITASGVALETVPARVLTTYVLAGAAVSLTVLGAVTGELSMPTGSDWLLVVAMAVVSTAVPIYLFYEGMDRIGASRAGIVVTFEPAVTVVMGVVLLGEPLTATTIVGGTLVIAGVLAIQRNAGDGGRT